jgi:von Willebrand factor type A domain
MKKSILTGILLSTLISLLFSCNRETKFESIQQDQGQLVVEPPVDLITSGYEKLFPLQKSTQSFNQESLEQNQSTVHFQVRLPNGTLLQDLTPSQMEIIENGLPVTQYSLTKNSTEKAEIADIVFVVDVTGSMTPTIEAAKLRLINFIRNSRQLGYHTRMCLVTFGDYTVKKCDRFYDNNPKDSSTLAEVEELISEITKLKAIAGFNDPGGTDLDENPMRALIDASNSPWKSNTHRFSILVTDAGFLYSPGNQGAVGNLAPKYTEVKSALSKSSMRVFAATQSMAGYNKKFNGDLGVVQLSNGQWFNFSDLVSGKITLDTILNQIVNELNTTFVAQYIVENQSGLDGSLPLSKRKVSVVLKDSNLGKVEFSQLKSNLPDGRKPYSKVFKLSDKKIKKSSLKVWLNKVEVYDFDLNASGQVEFKTAPPAGSRIDVEYIFENFKDSLVLKPLVAPIEMIADSFELYLNEVQVDSQYYKIEVADAKFKNILLLDSVFSVSDPFKIGEKQSLKVKVVYKTSRQ